MRGSLTVAISPPTGQDSDSATPVAFGPFEGDDSRSTVWRVLGSGGEGRVFGRRGEILSPLIGLKMARGWSRAHWGTNPTQTPTALSRYPTPRLEYGFPDVFEAKAAGAVAEVRKAAATAGIVEIDDVERQLKDAGCRR